jgi:hypothetical protein
LNVIMGGYSNFGDGTIISGTSMTVSGASATAAPAANGTFGLIEGINSPMYISHVAMNVFTGPGADAMATNDAAIGLTLDQGGLFSHNLATPTTWPLSGNTTLDPATTLTDNGGQACTSLIPPEQTCTMAFPELAVTGSLALASAQLTLALSPDVCPTLGAPIPLVSATKGVSGVFSQSIGGVITPIANGDLVLANPAAGCTPSAFQIAYNDSAGTVTATAVAAPSISVATSHTPSIPSSPVTLTATVTPAPGGGTVAFSSNGSVISGCSASAVNATSGKATCATSFAAVGDDNITASYSGDATIPPTGPSAVVTQVVVPAPIATITSASGVDTLPDVIRGTATDVGGPGVYAVVFYYKDVITGATGDFPAICANCGIGQTTTTWTVTLPANNPIGIYEFVVQAVDEASNFGPGSSVVVQVVT